MDKKIIVINGNNFSDPESFYAEIDKVLTKDLDWKTGHNLNAFNDLLWGGFGVFEYEEPVIILWENGAKSKEDFTDSKCDGQTLFDTLINIITDHEHIEFRLE